MSSCAPPSDDLHVTLLQVPSPFFGAAHVRSISKESPFAVEIVSEIFCRALQVEACEVGAAVPAPVPVPVPVPVGSAVSAEMIE